MTQAGRPILDAEDRRRQRGIRLSDREWAAVIERAAMAGLPVSVYARRLLTGHRVGAAVSVTDRAAWVELARVHSNLNQLSRALNEARVSGNKPAVTIDEIAASLSECKRQTAALRNEIIGVRHSESEPES